MTTNDVKSLRRSIIITLVSVLTPFLLFYTGILVKDHYKIIELSRYKVSKEYFDSTWFHYQLLIEDKTNAIETLSVNNDLSIAEIKDEIKIIHGVNNQIMLEIARINRTRGNNVSPTLPGSSGTK